MITGTPVGYTTLFRVYHYQSSKFRPFRTIITPYIAVQGWHCVTRHIVGIRILLLEYFCNRTSPFAFLLSVALHHLMLEMKIPQHFVSIMNTFSCCTAEVDVALYSKAKLRPVPFESREGDSTTCFLVLPQPPQLFGRLEDTATIVGELGLCALLLYERRTNFNLLYQPNNGFQDTTKVFVY